MPGSASAHARGQSCAPPNAQTLIARNSWRPGKTRHSPTSRALDDVRRRVADDQVIELELDRVEDLFVEPTIDPFDGRSLALRSGVEELGATLTTLRRLPDELTVRVILPPEALTARPAAQVEAAFHRQAQVLAAASWREGMAVRIMGRRQTPLGLVIGVVGGFTAYGLAYLAHQAHDRGSNPQAVALLVVAALALGSGWIVGWVTVESAILDWRAWRNASAVPRTIRVGQPLIRHAMPQS